MSPSSGTSVNKNNEPFYYGTENWHELATIAHTEIKAIFELRENSYEILRTLVMESAKGRSKFYLLIAKQALFLVKYLGRDSAAKVSKLADLAPELDESARIAMEQKARFNSAVIDTVFDCGVAAVGWVFGAYTGGLFLLIAGVGATGKCLVSATKLGEAIAGRQESVFDTGVGQVIDIGVTTVSLVGSGGGAYKTTAKAIAYWHKAGAVMAPSIVRHYGRNAALSIAKLALVEFPGLGLAGYDLLTKYHGSVFYGSNLQPFLDMQAQSPPLFCLPPEPIFQNPVDWLREAIEGPRISPWATECVR